jgi:hypothetical protein
MQTVESTEGNRQMLLLTKPQRNALFQLFRRDFPSWVTPFRQNSITREIE